MLVFERKIENETVINPWTFFFETIRCSCFYLGCCAVTSAVSLSAGTVLTLSVNSTGSALTLFAPLCFLCLLID